jgi:hypothetical protein
MPPPAAASKVSEVATSAASRTVQTDVKSLSPAVGHQNRNHIVTPNNDKKNATKLSALAQLLLSADSPPSPLYKAPLAPTAAPTVLFPRARTKLKSAPAPDQKVTVKMEVSKPIIVIEEKSDEDVETTNPLNSAKVARTPIRRKR